MLVYLLLMNIMSVAQITMSESNSASPWSDF